MISNLQSISLLAFLHNPTPIRTQFIVVEKPMLKYFYKNYFNYSLYV